MSTSCFGFRPSFALILGVFFVCACPPPDEGDGGPAPLGPWPLDTKLGAGEVRCGFVDDDRALIGGPLAYGVTGRSFRCHNANIRFLIQDGSRAFGNSVRGGNLIDIDLVRDVDEGEPGHDAFREFVVAWGARESTVDNIEVIDDGRNGGPGIIRVTGTPGPLTLAPQAAIVAQDLPVKMETDYILHADRAEIEISTRAINVSDDQIYGVLALDFLALGGQNKPFTPITGVGDIPFFTNAPFIASFGDDVSYAYVCGNDRDINVFFGDNSVYAPACADDVIVAKDASLSRTILVGDGTLESVARRAYEMRGVEVGTVDGVVRTTSGDPVSGVPVYFIRDGVDVLDDDARVMAETVTDSDGNYALSVEPGPGFVIASRPSTERSGQVSTTVVAGARVSHDLTMSGVGTIQVSTTFRDFDGTIGRARPMKVTVLPKAGALVASKILGEPRPRGAVRSVGDADGVIAIDIAPGEYEVIASRGFEYTIDSHTVVVIAGAASVVDAEIAHVVDTRGFVGAEFHQHSLASTDASVPLPIKVLENAAEGIEFAASTEHDNVTDYTPYVEALGLTEDLTCVPGNEVSYQGIGHINVYPWNIDPTDPQKDTGTRLWWMTTLPELFLDLRARAGDPIIQLNHPRSAQTGTFSSMRLDPTTASQVPRSRPSLETLPPEVYERWPVTFEAIELNNDVGTPADFTDEAQADLHARATSDPSTIPVLADYFALMGAGFHVAAMGNSDTHELGEGVGWPRNFVFVDDDSIGAVTKEVVTAAIRAQRVGVGVGCFLDVTHLGARAMGHGDALTATPDAIHLRLQAPSWISMNAVEVYINGRVVPLSPNGDGGFQIDPLGVTSTSIDGFAVDETVRLDVDIEGFPAGDFVMVVLARGDETGPVGNGRALCYAPPLYVDDGGDGFVGWFEGTSTLGQ